MIHGITVNNFRYAVERVQYIGCSDPASSYIWGELLCKENLRSFTNRQWEKWYADIVLNVPQILCQSNLSLISINLDSCHILNNYIVSQIKKLKGLPIGVEWTEKKEAVSNYNWDKIGSVLRELRKDGFKIILDDVGKGECVLHRATTCTPNIVKIDGSIFKKSIVDLNTYIFLASIIKLFKKLDIIVAVEWVETLSNYLHAQKLKASYAQGYYWNEKKVDFNILMENNFEGFLTTEVVNQEEFEDAIENGCAFVLSSEETQKYNITVSYK